MKYPKELWQPSLSVCGGFPFKGRLDVPNKRTIAAMEEALALIADENTEKYSIEEALQELKK